MVEAWSTRGATTRYEEIPGRNHFDVIAPLADPRSAMTARIVALSQSGPRRLTRPATQAVRSTTLSTIRKMPIAKMRK